MAQVAPDTPAYQKGVVSAQKLLATVAAGTDHVTVGVPPNAETIIVTADSFATPPTVYCEGTGTLYKYSGAHASPNPLITPADTWVFDISSAVDEQVTIQFSAAPSDQWYVYADSAARVVFDAANRRNDRGQVYTIPSVPNTAANDHPPAELFCTSNTFAAAGTLIAAPGAGQRIRLFAAQLMNYGTAGAWRLYNSSDTVTYLTCAESGSAELAYPLTGVALPTNNALYCTLVTGGGSCRAMAAYTVEDV